MFLHFCPDEIFPFSDPVEACRKLSLLHPDVIFTDIVMEGLDGLTLLRSASKALPRCRFVIISGFANFEYARQAIDLKVDSYLLKPIERSALEEVYHKLREALQEPEPPARKLRISEEALRYIREHSAEKLSITPEMGIGVLCTIRFSSLIFVCLSCQAVRPEAAVPPPPRDCGYRPKPAAAHTAPPAGCGSAGSDHRFSL